MVSESELHQKKYIIKSKVAKKIEFVDLMDNFIGGQTNPVIFIDSDGRYSYAKNFIELKKYISCLSDSFLLKIKKEKFIKLCKEAITFFEISNKKSKITALHECEQIFIKNRLLAKNKQLYK